MIELVKLDRAFVLAVLWNAPLLLVLRGVDLIFVVSGMLGMLVAFLYFGWRSDGFCRFVLKAEADRDVFKGKCKVLFGAYTVVLVVLVVCIVGGFRVSG